MANLLTVLAHSELGGGSKLNCEVLNDELAFEVRWAIAGASIVMQLVAKLEPNEYMSFGPSGDDTKTTMIGGDVAVAWVDRETLKGFAEDYFLADKSQCSGRTGSCPDERFAENTNNIRLLNAAMVNGYSIVTYQRPLKASDEYDRRIYTNGSQAVIWAIGPLNQRKEVSFHTSYLKKNKFVDFARPAKWNCPMPESELAAVRPAPSATFESRTYLPKVSDVTPIPAEVAPEDAEVAQPPRRQAARRGGNRRQPAQQQIVDEEEEDERAAGRQQTRRGSGNRGGQRGSGSTTNAVRAVPPPTPVKKTNAWVIPPIRCDEPEDGVYYAQMGPTGGKHGYPAITGHVGWGISWYINGLLIPEINVVRGKTYSFIVEGGEDPEIPAKYHPFYITDDYIGGYEHKTEEEKKQVKIFAGVKRAKDGTLVPTGTGRLCHWTEIGDVDADEFESFGAYQRHLELKCDHGEPGIIHWTPDSNTPDTVYYQCFSHRHLGWKINVRDTCDEQSAASELQETIVEAPEEINHSELEASPSIQVETRFQRSALLA